MTTGTAGNDNLTNDRFVQHEVIDALAGDDVITTSHPAVPNATITANGGEGYDTLKVSGTFRSGSVESAYSGGFYIRQNASTHYDVDYTSIERLELSGALFMSGTPPLFTTGDSDDILRFSAFVSDMAADIVTGLGNDEVYLIGAYGALSVTTGEGNDIISFLSLTSGIGNVNGFGGAGDDIYEIGERSAFANENANEGTDLVRTSRATYALGVNLENLTGLSDAGQRLSGNGVGNVITAGNGNDTIFGNGGDDTIYGNDGDDRIYGDYEDPFAGASVPPSGNNFLYGGAGNDHLIAWNGNDLLSGGSGSDILDGHNGNDTADYAVEGGVLGVFVNLGTAAVASPGYPASGRIVQPNEAIDSFGDADFLISIENVRGTAYADWLYGSSVANRFESGGGNDYLDGAGGADQMIGGLGDDIYVVDQAGDVVTELAGEGIDTVRSAIGSRTDYTMLYVLPDHVENFVGTAAAGQGVHGNAGDNVMTMGAGNDLIVMDGGGIDSVAAGSGNDYIYYGGALTALDQNDGGAGFDTIGLLGVYELTLEAGTLTGIEKLVMYSSGDAALPNSYAITTLDANVAAGQILQVVALGLKAGENLAFFGHAETDGGFNIQSGAGHDTLVGGRRNDSISGGAGNDLIYALNGDDQVQGGVGDDQIYGGGGNDRLAGGAGRDLLNGGFGDDVFVYAAPGDSTGTGHDVIHVFDARIDRIDLATDAAWNGSVGTGTLSEATFDADLAAAVDGLMQANGAVLFTPDAGDRAGRSFAVIDANGDGAYSAGADYVIEFADPLVPLTGTDIFV